METRKLAKQRVAVVAEQQLGVMVVAAALVGEDGERNGKMNPLLERTRGFAAPKVDRIAISNLSSEVIRTVVVGQPSPPTCSYLGFGNVLHQKPHLIVKSTGWFGLFVFPRFVD